MRKLFFALLLLLPAVSHAQIFKLTRITSSGNATIDAAFDAEIQKIENDINKDIPASSPPRLVKGMANSQAASSKGLATDYITHFDTFTVGAGLGLGADLEKDETLDSELSGVGMTGGFQLGLNTAIFADRSFLGLDPKKTTLMFNFFSYNINKDFDENNVKAKLSSFGFMGTYRLSDTSGSRLFGWDGVRLHTGYQYSATDITFSSTLSEDASGTVTGGGNISGTITGNPKATIKTSTHSIPIEISSGVNFLWIMSFYGGVGTDFNMGSSQAKGDLNAQDSTISCNGGVCGGGQSAQVRATADIDEKGKVQPFFLRGFAGFQVNLPFTRIYVHANKVFGTEVYSLATGLRLAF